MATAGKVVVHVGAKVGALRSGMAKAGQVVRGFGRKVAAVRSKVLGLGTALIALAAGGGALFAIKKAFGDVDSLGKTADKIGITTEALAGLRHAGELSGVGMKELDKSLEFMVRNLGEAVSGSGTAVDALDRLGLSAGELVQLAPEVAVGRISDAMGGLSTHAEKVSTAVDIFGRSGAAMIDTLSGGSKALAETAAEADALGLAFSRFEVRQVELANDAMSRLKALFAGAFRTAAIKLAPVLGAVVTTLVELAKEGKGIGPFLAGGLKLAIKAAGFFGDALAALKFGYLKLRELAMAAINSIVKGLGKLAGALDWILGSVGIDSELEGFMNGIGAATEASLGLARSSLEEFLLEDLPSEKIDKFMRDVEKAAAETRAKLLRDSLAGGLSSMIDALPGFVAKAAAIPDTILGKAIATLKSKSYEVKTAGAIAVRAESAVTPAARRSVTVTEKIEKTGRDQLAELQDGNRIAEEIREELRRPDLQVLSF